MSVDRGVYTGATLKQRTAAGEEAHIRHGHGTYRYTNPTFTYTGDWVNGVKHGHGVFSVGVDSSQTKLQPHSVYEGTFLHGEMTGQGLKRWRDGSSYSGSFQNGAMHGEGVWMSHGAKYEGGFRDDRRDGSGTLTCGPGPTEFRGEFFQHQKHGEGWCQWSDGATYQGTYSFDLRDGRGEETIADGSSFTGSFRNGFRHGHGVFQHAPTGLMIEGEFERGSPVLRPVMIKLRVPKHLASALPAGDPQTHRSSSREQKRLGTSSSGKESPTPSTGSASSDERKASATSKLSKKKQEELRKAQEELAAYKATLTEGVVFDEETGSEIPVIDEGLDITITPGHKFPVYYLCACTKDGTVAQSESGRTFRITIQVHPVPVDIPVEKHTSRSRHNAEASPSAGEVDPDDVPFIAFCTCEGAKTVEWKPKPPPSEEERRAKAERVAAEEKTASGKKKKGVGAAAAVSSPVKSGSAGKRRNAPPPVVDGPPPPFVCTGACTSGVPRTLLVTSILRTVKHGYARTEELWVAGASTPGLHVDLIVEDVTMGIVPPSASAASSPQPQRSPRLRTNAPASSGGDELGPSPSSLTFHTLRPYPLKLLTAGVLPKKKKAPLKKPSAAAAATPKAAAAATTAAAH